MPPLLNDEDVSDLTPNLRWVMGASFLGGITGGALLFRPSLSPSQLGWEESLIGLAAATAFGTAGGWLGTTCGLAAKILLRRLGLGRSWWAAIAVAFLTPPILVLMLSLY